MAKYQYKTIQLHHQKDSSLIVTPSQSFLDEELTEWKAFDQTQADRLKATMAAIGLKSEAEEATALSETSQLAKKIESMLTTIHRVTDQSSYRAFMLAQEDNPIMKAMKICMSDAVISDTIFNSRSEKHDEDADIVYTKSTAIYVVELIHFTMTHQDQNIQYILPPQHHASREVAQGFCLVNLEPLVRSLAKKAGKSVHCIDLDINAEHESLDMYNRGVSLFDLCGCHPRKEVYPLAKGGAKKQTKTDAESQMQSEDHSHHIKRCFITTSTKKNANARKKNVSRIAQQIQTFLVRVEKGDQLILNLGLDSVLNEATHSAWGFIFTQDEIISIVHHIQDTCERVGARIILSFEGGYDDLVNQAVMPSVLSRAETTPSLAFSTIASDEYFTPKTKTTAPKHVDKQSAACRGPSKTTKPAGRKKSRPAKETTAHPPKEQQASSKWVSGLTFKAGKGGTIIISHSTPSGSGYIEEKLKDIYGRSFPLWLLTAEKALLAARTGADTAENTREHRGRNAKRSEYTINQQAYIVTLARYINYTLNSTDASQATNELLAQAYDLLNKFIQLDTRNTVTAEQVIHRSWWITSHGNHVAHLTEITSHDSGGLNAHEISAEMSPFWVAEKQSAVSRTYNENEGTKDPSEITLIPTPASRSMSIDMSRVASPSNGKRNHAKRKPQPTAGARKRSKKETPTSTTCFTINKLSTDEILISGPNVRTTLARCYEENFNEWLTISERALTCLNGPKAKMGMAAANSMRANAIAYIRLLIKKLISTPSLPRTGKENSHAYFTRGAALLIGFISIYSKWQSELNIKVAADDASRFNIHHIDALFARHSWLAKGANLTQCMKTCPQNTDAIFNATYWKDHHDAAMTSWKQTNPSHNKHNPHTATEAYRKPDPASSDASSASPTLLALPSSGGAVAGSLSGFISRAACPSFPTPIIMRSLRCDGAFAPFTDPNSPTIFGDDPGFSPNFEPWEHPQAGSWTSGEDSDGDTDFSTRQAPPTTSMQVMQGNTSHATTIFFPDWRDDEANKEWRKSNHALVGPSTR